MPERLYVGEPLPKEQINIISNGSGEFSPLEGHGWFNPMKIDGNEKCQYRPCEVLAGKHSVEVTYNWWTKANFTAVVATAIPATIALCVATFGISCSMGIGIPGYLPLFDMVCQGVLEFSTQGGRNYTVKIAAIGNDVENIMQNTSLVIEDAESKQAVTSILMTCAKGEPSKERSDTNEPRNPLTP